MDVLQPCHFETAIGIGIMKNQWSNILNDVQQYGHKTVVCEFVSQQQILSVFVFCFFYSMHVYILFTRQIRLLFDQVLFSLIHKFSFFIMNFETCGSRGTKSSVTLICN